jgi:hypothetical protein
MRLMFLLPLDAAGMLPPRFLSSAAKPVSTMATASAEIALYDALGTDM